VPDRFTFSNGNDHSSAAFILRADEIFPVEFTGCDDSGVSLLGGQHIFNGTRKTHPKCGAEMVPRTATKESNIGRPSGAMFDVSEVSYVMPA
jgi:hypothetical protein